MTFLLLYLVVAAPIAVVFFASLILSGRISRDEEALEDARAV